jgi:RNA polymerase-binding transcription factor DksA
MLFAGNHLIRHTTGLHSDSTRDVEAKEEMKHLSSDDIRSLHQRLVAMRNQLLDEIRTAQADIRTSHEALEGEVSSGSDTSEQTRFEELRRAEIAVDERKLDAVFEAERKMNEGLYGICTDCGGPIPTDRLFALPTAVRCASCENRSVSKLG